MSFKKLDSGFICTNCGKDVQPLGYTSRNHCPYCLCSIHVDIDPGDRANNCKGLLVPVGIEYNAKKGYIIVHKCRNCGEIKKNKAAEDDSYELILNIMKNTRNSFNTALSLIVLSGAQTDFLKRMYENETNHFSASCIYLGNMPHFLQQHTGKYHPIKGGNPAYGNHQ